MRKSDDYNLDAGNRFDLLVEIVNRGIEFSVAGAVTSSLNIVAGGVLLRPRVTGEEVALGRIGKRPVGLPARSFDFNADWQTSFLEGLSFDIGVSHVGGVYGYELLSAGAYDLIPGRVLSAYLTIDF